MEDFGGGEELSRDRENGSCLYYLFVFRRKGKKEMLVKR